MDNPTEIKRRGYLSFFKDGVLDITKCKNGVGDWEITPLHETFDTLEQAKARVKELQAEEDRKFK
tara:strand:+ start:95 stop:289 length:195 start_codon:yes stop_codon:yes gene_type:complete